MLEPSQVATIEAEPEPDGYVNCDCGAILGYKARVGKAIYLHTFAYPPSSVNHKLAGRRVNARILAGDVACPYCGRWVIWTGAELPERARKMQT